MPWPVIIQIIFSVLGLFHFGATVATYQKVKGIANQAKKS